MEKKRTEEWEYRRSSFDRTGWAFAGRADDSERLRQIRWQARLSEENGTEIGWGEKVFVSEGATVAVDSLVMGDYSYVGSECQLGGELRIGSHVSVNAGALVRGKITLGDDVRIASGAQILGFNHASDDLEQPIRCQGIVSRGITVGNDVWIGANAVIVDGVSVGSHVIIGAGAVVTKDIPSWAVAVGNPARVIKDRRTGKSLPATAGKIALWRDFQKKTAEKMEGLLLSYIDRDRDIPRDTPGAPDKARPWSDYVELASHVGMEPPYWSKEDLIERIQSFQDKKTGLVRGPYGEGADLGEEPDKARLMTDNHTAYMVMSAGYALECLGSHLKYPVKVAEELRHGELHDQLGRLDWKEGGWSAGAWVDHYGSARAFNELYHGGKGDVADLFGWLNLSCSGETGLWSPMGAGNSRLHGVNGFYRLTRGSYAQWGVPLPYPEAAVDSVLAHAADPRYMAQGKATACFILDIIHPLWLCYRQTGYRRKEGEAVAEYWLNNTMARWEAGRGLSFSTAKGAEPGLQGTEMWLSIAWLCADLLGYDGLPGWGPKGVHRPEPIVSALPVPY